MIFTEKKITITNNQCKIDSPVVLYRGDYNVEVRFTIVSSPYKYSNKQETNVIESTEASYGQLVIQTPNTTPIFSEVTATKKGAITFTITAEMIDEITEVGNYTFQIRLLDENKESRATIPEVENGIEIREPIATEDVTDTNEVGVAAVGYALTTVGTTEDAFDSQGNYNKTTWGTGDRITAAKLNKIEAGIDGVNKKVASGGTSGGTVDLSGYVTKETGNANQITFADGQTFQAKLDAGTLKGDKGDKGEQGEIGAQGPKGDKGDDGVTTSIVVNGNTYTHVDGVITLPNYPTNVTGGEIIAGGLTTTAQTLLISILRSAVFTSDQSTNIALLQSELAKGNSGGGSETTRYTITNTLNNATTNNNIALVDANSSYTAIIRENEGYTLDAITVTMGGIDITSSAVSGTTITITSVTGNVVITVTTTESGSSSGGGMVTDGLVSYFDFRTAEYNNSGAGGSTIISATQGNGSLFCWKTNGISTQDEYGITQTTTRAWLYSGTGGTTQTTITGSFTFACYGYTNSNTQFFGAWGGYTNVSPDIKLQPTYNTSSSTASVAAEQYATRDLPNGSGFRSYIVTADADTGIAKIYVGGVLAKTYTGSDYSDFVSWYVNGVAITQVQVKPTACAIYNRTFTDIEAVDMHDFFKTLEVK